MILSLTHNPQLRLLIGTATSTKPRAVLDSEVDNNDMEPASHLHFLRHTTMRLYIYRSVTSRPSMPAASLDKAILRSSHSHNTLFTRLFPTMPLCNHAVHTTHLFTPLSSTTPLYNRSLHTTPLFTRHSVEVLIYDFALSQFLVSLSPATTTQEIHHHGLQQAPLRPPC
jgi:hypothetical protein